MKEDISTSCFALVVGLMYGYVIGMYGGIIISRHCQKWAQKFLNFMRRKLWKEAQ